MTVIISGTDGVSDVDGTAGTPALRGTDANTGIFFGADQVGVATNGVERVEFGNSETVFNDGGANVDFRVEGDTDANLLFVDASADNVGIGTSSPDAKLTITRGATSAFSIKMVRAGRTDQGVFTDGAGIALRGVDATNGATFVAVAGDNVDSNDYDHIRFSVEGSERGRFTANGLCFNGDTAAANALDDYEEGTFSPVIVGRTTDGTASYTNQLGVYTKVGNLVTVQILLTWSGGTGTGALDVGNLPFTSKATFIYSFSIGGMSGLNVSQVAGTYLQARVLNSATRIQIQAIIQSNGDDGGAPYDAAGVIVVGGSYMV